MRGENIIREVCIRESKSGENREWYVLYSIIPSFVWLN